MILWSPACLTRLLHWVPERPGLQVSPGDLDRLHWMRDVTYDEDRSQVRASLCCPSFRRGTPSPQRSRMLPCRPGGITAPDGVAVRWCATLDPVEPMQRLPG